MCSGREESFRAFCKPRAVIPTVVEAATQPPLVARPGFPSRCAALSYRRGLLRIRFAPLRMTRRNAPANPAATKHDLSIVNDRSLSGRYGALRVVQSHVGPIVVQWHHSRNRSGMIVADLYESFEGAAVTDPGSRMPVHTIDLEFLAKQIFRISDNHP